MGKEVLQHHKDKDVILAFSSLGSLGKVFDWGQAEKSVNFAIGTTVNSTTRDLLVALLGKFEPRVVMLCVLLRPTCASSALASWQELKPLGIGCSSSLSDKSHLGFVGGKFATLIPL